MTRTYRYVSSGRESWLEKYSFSNYVLCTLLAAVLIMGVRCYFSGKIPSTIVMSVVVSIAAAVAALADGKAAWQKISKLIITTIVAFIQFQAVRLEKGIQASQAAADKTTQTSQTEEFRKKFKAVLDQQEKSEADRGVEFISTIGKLDKNLSKQEAVLSQTRPRAAFSIAEVSTERKGLFVKVRLVNSGNDSANRALSLMQAYLVPDSLSEVPHTTDGEPIVQNFEAAWLDDYSDTATYHNHNTKIWRDTIVPGPVDKFEEPIPPAATLRDGNVYSLFILLRIQYSDQMGTRTYNECRETIYRPGEDSFIDFQPCSLLGEAYQPSKYPTEKLYYLPKSSR